MTFQTGVRSQMARRLLTDDDVDYANGGGNMLRGLTDGRSAMWIGWLGNILRRRTTFSHTNVVVVRRLLRNRSRNDDSSRGIFLLMTI